jgi:hypothetical protein
MFQRPISVIKILEQDGKPIDKFECIQLKPKTLSIHVLLGYGYSYRLYRVTMSITYLPVEVLERIFDRGCEQDPGYDGFPTRASIKAKLKSFARSLIQVCQQWRLIVLASRRYWITVATLYFDHDSPSKVVQSLIQFNRALHSANGSDIDIVFESTRSSLSLELNRGNLLKLRSLGLFLHGMLMSLDYIRYWRLLYAKLPAPEPLEFLLNMLCSDIEPKRFNRLIGMAIYSDNTQPLFPNKLSSNYFPLFSLANNAQKPADTGIRVSGLGLIFPPTFTSIDYGHLRWFGIGVERYPVSKIKPLLSETVGVRTLKIVGGEIRDESFDSSSAIVVPNITSLHLAAAHVSILSMCRFPFLQMLRLNFHRYDRLRRDKMYKRTQWPQFPSLHSIYVENLSSKIDFDFLISRLSAPNLVTFELHTDASLQEERKYKKMLRSPQWPKIFKAPKVLKLSGYPWEIALFLRRMQLDAVQEFSLLIYYDRFLTDVNLAPPIAMPALEMLTIGSGYPILHGSLLWNLEAPALNSLTLSGPFTEQTEYNNNIGLRLFKSITHLSIKSGRDVSGRDWASTVSDFPGITRLAIVVNTANRKDQIISTLLSIMEFIGELKFNNIAQLRSVQIHLQGEYDSLFHLNSQLCSVFLSKLQELRYSGPLNHIDIKLECDWCRPEYGRIERTVRRGSGIWEDRTNRSKRIRN